MSALNIKVPAGLHARLKLAARTTGRTMQEIACRALAGSLTTLRSYVEVAGRTVAAAELGGEPRLNFLLAEEDDAQRRMEEGGIPCLTTRAAKLPSRID